MGCESVPTFLTCHEALFGGLLAKGAAINGANGRVAEIVLGEARLGPCAAARVEIGTTEPSPSCGAATKFEDFSSAIVSALGRTRVSVGAEVVAGETDSCRNCGAREGTVTSLTRVSREMAGFGAENIEPTTGWIAPPGFTRFEAMR
jgi:hypothetical protein